jgi:hypothetical protein
MPALLSELFPVVRGNDGHGRRVQVGDRIEQPPHVAIRVGDLGVVAMRKSWPAGGT